MRKTSDGISAEDWARVAELSADLLNASAEEDELEARLALGRLFALLDELEAIYGRKPSLLATRADFTDPSPDACSLLILAENPEGLHDQVVARYAERWGDVDGL